MGNNSTFCNGCAEVIQGFPECFDHDSYNYSPITFESELQSFAFSFRIPKIVNTVGGAFTGAAQLKYESLLTGKVWLFDVTVAAFGVLTITSAEYPNGLILRGDTLKMSIIDTDPYTILRFNDGALDSQTCLLIDVDTNKLLFNGTKVITWA